ncbi:MAG: PorT family protein [Mariniphaga sp.]|nr:PorT family protein [Mariniphaga sp.]
MSEKMNIYTKIYFILSIMITAPGVFAQIVNLKGGVNFANMAITDNQNIREDTQMRSGFHAGATYGFPTGKNLIFESGLYLSSKGYKSIDKLMHQGQNYEHSEQLNLLYLEIHPLAVRAITNPGIVKIYGTAGPYLSYGLKGTRREEDIAGRNSHITTNKIDWGSGRDVGRLDYGLSLGAGLSIDPIQIGVSYSLGLFNIRNSLGDMIFPIFGKVSDSAKNHVFGISLGYELF